MSKKGSWLLGTVGRIVLGSAAVLLLLSYLSVLINPAKFWFISLFGLFFVPLALVNFILLITALFLRSRAALIPLIALLPSLMFLSTIVQPPFKNSKGDLEVNQSKLKVISYNVGRFALYDKNSDISSEEACTDSLFKWLIKQDADIICLQEMYINTDGDAKTYLKEKLKDYSSELYINSDGTGWCGNVTLSRVPAISKGKIEFDNSSNLAFFSDYCFGDSKFRVFNCHFESYNISLSHLATSFEKKEEIIYETGGKMKTSIVRRPKQVGQVLKNIEECPIEALICGDFNDTPMSYTYFRMRKDRNDSFVKAGTGFGATYSALWPLLRIDYIMFPDAYKVLSHSTPRLKYSDHYPVIAEIVL